MKKVLLKSSLVLGILVVLSISTILYQNTYNYKAVPVQIPVSTGTLNGKLVLPKNYDGKLGLVVFIHGDGPADASFNGKYEPLWEELVTQGYACLSWNKPGIGGSSGNWLTQTMEDRAAEAIEAINWAKALPEIDTKRIGLWGASQAGWVIPKIVRRDKNIAFTILVAPAINWTDQGLYNTLAQRKKDGSSLKEQELARNNYEWALSMLKKNASYQDYHSNEKADKSLSKDRWEFILKNYQSDATEDLKYFYTPVKLFLGGRDINVDSNNSKTVYEAQVPKELLSVTLIPSADHSMLKASLVDSNILTVLTAYFAPRQLVDKRYIEDIRAFLQAIN
jgi:alpha/beta superfamily hydrolase